MKTNLLLLDSYRNIENLVSFAFSFSNRFNRKLKITYVFDFSWMSQSYVVGATGPVDPSLVTAETQAKKEFDVAEKKIRGIVTEYMKHNAVKVPFEIGVSQINRIDLVNEELEQNQGMILLISNHQSYTELSDGLVGYPNIIEHAKCPVFVIPENTSLPVLKNVVYATGYNPEDITSLKHLSNFMKQSENTHITVLHNEKDYNFDEKLKWAGFKEIVKEEIDAKDFGFTLKTRKDFLRGIEEYTAENNPDLLVVLHENKGFFKHIFTSNEIKNVLTHFNKPVLVYHEKED
ncbi:MAG TPA: universal stress protein [Draconibacterium sp.]|nr:universal stress protein [Draconibacterium sp.]